MSIYEQMDSRISTYKGLDRDSLVEAFKAYGTCPEAMIVQSYPTTQGSYWEEAHTALNARI